MNFKDDGDAIEISEKITGFSENIVIILLFTDNFIIKATTESCLSKKRKIAEPRFISQITDVHL